MTTMPTSAEDRLSQLGIHLPEAPAPFGAYVPAVQTGPLLFLFFERDARDFRSLRADTGCRWKSLGFESRPTGGDHGHAQCVGADQETTRFAQPCEPGCAARRVCRGHERIHRTC